MEVTVDDLARNVLSLYMNSPPLRRILVAIAGVPGSGKSTAAYPLAAGINDLLEQVRVPLRTSTPNTASENSEPTLDSLRIAKQVAICVGLDGWHHTRKELDAFPDPIEAHRRRGAPFTFDSPSYLSFINSLRTAPPLPGIPFPTFSHELKDPLDSPFPILPSHRIIIIEGLYTLLDQEVWEEAANEMDVRVWIECEESVARERLIKRHLESGVETSLEAAGKRVDLSDMVNGVFIKENRVPPEYLVVPLEFTIK